MILLSVEDIGSVRLRRLIAVFRMGRGLKQRCRGGSISCIFVIHASLSLGSALDFTLEICQMVYEEKFGCFITDISTEYAL